MSKWLRIKMNLWLLLNHIILSQTCSKLQNDSSELKIVKSITAWKKSICWGYEGRKVRLQIFLVPTNFESHVKMAWLPSKVLLRLAKFSKWKSSHAAKEHCRQFNGLWLILQYQWLNIYNFSRDKPSNKKKCWCFLGFILLLGVKFWRVKLKHSMDIS